jgi:hypothetical protein
MLYQGERIPLLTRHRRQSWERSSPLGGRHSERNRFARSQVVESRGTSEVVAGAYSAVVSMVLNADYAALCMIRLHPCAEPRLRAAKAASA